MRRRAFVGSLIGLVMTPSLGVSSSPLQPRRSVPVADKRLMSLLQMIRRRRKAVMRDLANGMEDAFWGTPPKMDGSTLMGSRHFIAERHG